MCKKKQRNFLMRLPTPHPMLEQAKKIRVLFITDEMEVGGTQRQIVHIARSLDKTRFEATVVYFCNRSFLVDELESAGVRVIEISKRKRLDIGFLRKLVRMLQTGGFDVVHCFAFTGELWGAIARRFLPRASRPALITSVRNKYDCNGVSNGGLRLNHPLWWPTQLLAVSTREIKCNYRTVPLWSCITA